MPPVIDPLVRFNRHWEIDNETGCWNWTAGKCKYGYSRFKADGCFLGHRFSYQTFVGPLDPKLTVDHRCKNTSCVNPRHLRQMPRGENMLEGNSPAALNKRMTHCQNGHEFNEENTYTYKGKKRLCRPCRNAYQRKWQAARKAQSV